MKNTSEKEKTSFPDAPWLRPLAPAGGPRYKQIVTQVIEAINNGTLQPGDRLPAQRELASWLDVDLTTVTRAYTAIRQRGLLQAASGRGSFIAVPQQIQTHLDLSMNIPPGNARILPLIGEAMTRLQLNADVSSLMSYHPGAGEPAERAAGALWLAPLLGPLDSARVVVSSGAQAAISALLILLTRPGEVIVADELTYPGFITAARQLGRNVVGVKGDEEGMLPESLLQACRQHEAKVVYLNPTIHNPTAVTLSEARRREIARLATENGWTLLEDDPYGLLPAEPMTPLAALAPAHSWYISTLSKCLTPGLRIAWVVIPEGMSYEPLAHALRSLTLVANPLMSAVVTDWVHTGIAAELLSQLREENHRRQQLVASMLSHPLQAHPYGLHVWLTLPPHWDPYSLTNTASRAGLGIAPSHVFSPQGQGPGAVRISLGGAKDYRELQQGLRRLDSVLNGQNYHQMNEIV
nr:PLP-dependent aminotransferase family protein [Raoultella terrigena]